MGVSAIGATVAAGAAAHPSAHSAAAKLGANLRLDAVGVETEQRRGGHGVARVLDGVVGHRQHVGSHFDLHLHFAVHARAERAVEVGERDEYREQRDALLHHGLRLDLLDGACETAIGVRIHDDNRGLARLDLADIGFVELGAHPDLCEVGHLDDGGPAADGAGRGRDHHAQRHRFFNNGADDGGGDGGVFETLLGEVEVGALTDYRCIGVGEVQCRRFMFLSGDDLLREHVVRTLLLRLGHAELCLGRVQVRLRLVELVLHVAGVDLDDEVPDSHGRSRLDRHARDQAAGLGLHLDDVDRFHDAVGLRVDDDIAARDRGRRNGTGARRRAVAGRSEYGRAKRDNKG